MGKLHELLAVEPDLKGAAEKIIAETINTFTKKANHFEARHKNYRPKDEDGENFAPETQEMVTTVPQKLEHTKEIVSNYLDAVSQKELTNTEASAILEIDGIPLLNRPLPATLLLGLEGRLKQLREVYNSLPTLDPAENWKWDDQTKTYEAEPKETYKTKKVFRNHVKAPATDKHAAQVETYTEDERIGTWNTKRWSGCLTPAEKSAVLARVDKLTQAVKKARQRANDNEVKDIKLGSLLFDFINVPIKR
jgi:transcription termination factor NusB